MAQSQASSANNGQRVPVGRAAQKRRTRAAIVDATTQLVLGGATPSLDQIAAAADVSRRTIYMHFPTLDQLLLDATVGALSNTVVHTALAVESDDPVERVDVLVRAVLATADTTLAMGRKIIALTVDRSSAGEQTRRGLRRVQWIEDALQPLRERVTAEQFDRLVSGLSLVIGWEAMIILRDVRGLDPHDEAIILRWAARALVQSVLAE